MPQGSLPTPDAFGSSATDSDLPDWLTGSDLDTSGGSDLLLSRALALPTLQADLLDALGRGAAPEPVIAPTPKPIAADAEEIDGWSVARQLVAHDPSGPADSVSFRITVANHSPVERHECRCRFPLPTGLKGARASNSPRRTPAGLEWSLGTLAPDAAATLLVRLPLTPATAKYRTEPAVALVSTRPDRTLALCVACDHPPVVPAGVPVPVRVTIANRGTSASGCLRIEAFQQNKSSAVVRADIEPLAGHRSRAVELLLPSAVPGPTPCRIVVTTPGHPPIHTTTEYTTAAADLAISLAAPEVVETDDEITCRVMVTNRGALPAAGVRASFAIPEELLFREATNGGTLSVEGDRVEWEPFDLPAAGQWESTVRVAGFAPGRIKLLTTVSVAGTDRTAEAPLACTVRRITGGSSLAELLAGLGAHPSDENEDGVRSGATASTGERHLMFRVAGSRFAALLRDVREVLRPLPVTPVPGTPNWLVGVANVRGDIVPVVDLAEFLELGNPDSARGLVILSPAGEERLGLLVDDVLGIRPLAPGEGDVPGDEALVRFLAGVTLDAAGVIHRLDALKLLAATDVASGATV